ncbi:asparagine synthetase [Salinisphaera sp. T31B1]
MQATLAHRGPDQSGEHLFETADGGEVALAHCRLSIIDLDGGRQPMFDADYVLVYNGEIYNYQALRKELVAGGCRFDDASDTAVVLQAYKQWGIDCLSRFRGMFAFALWDAAAGRMIFARDPFGKKPLFFHRQGSRLVFGSEIKAVLAFPGVRRCADPTVLSDYFLYRYVPQPHTLFDGIEKLPAGSYAIWERGELTTHRYFTPPDAQPRATAPADRRMPVDGFLDRLTDAVAIRMISDVPYGAFLSGGLDSSAIVALMARQSTQPIRTFSVGFAEADYSELDHARTVAEHIGADHHELRLSPDDLMDHLPALTRFRDAPVAETADIPIYLLSLEAGRHVKMVLTGEGSDELLAGYPKHAFERYAPAYGALPDPVRHKLIEPTIASLPYRYRRIKTVAATLGLADPDERLPRWFGALARAERERLLAPQSVDRAPVDARWARVAGNSALRHALYFDQASWLPDNLLERGDRMTMAASIEARMPFLDEELAAYVSGLPDRWRLRRHTGKYLLREAMRRLLPAAIIDRPKVGFRVPVNEWFRGPMQDYLREHLIADATRTRDYYRPGAVARVLDEHAAGRQNHEKLIWTMLNLELWHRHCLEMRP